MTDEPDTFTPLGSAALRVVTGVRQMLDRHGRDLERERAATDATTTTLARREAEIRERAGEAKPEPREAAE